MKNYLLGAFLFASAVGLAQSIVTIAGNGTHGFGGDNAAATSAALSWPFAVRMDNNNNLYIADETNNRVRKIAASTGIITTIAGNGTAGYSGDGAAATQAELQHPAGLAIDAQGNIFISDRENSVVRKVTISTGIITTVAGNGTQGYRDSVQATSAELSSPSGLAFDASGNLYIADLGNSRVRKLTMSTGMITTFAGEGVVGYCGDGEVPTKAMLNKPSDVAFDSHGNFFIADQGSHIIRKVMANSGLIYTYTGSVGVAGSYGDGGLAQTALFSHPACLAIDRNDNIYITDLDSSKIRRIDATTFVVTTVAGTGVAGYNGDSHPGSSTQLNYPNGITTDAAGNLYIADVGNDRIRKVSVLTGVNDVADDVQLEMYPNPFSGSTYLHVTTNAERPLTISTYNVVGQKIAETQQVANQNTISVGATLDAGCYTVVVSDDSHRQIGCFKVVKE